VVYSFADFELVPERYELRRGGRAVAIEPRVCETLAYLIAQRHRVVSKQELIDRVWPQQFVSDAALARSVREIRRVLGGAEWIETVYGRGFRFLGEVAETAGAAGAEPASAGSPSRPGSLVVLPFVDLSPTRDQDWFCDGLTLELIAALSRVAGLSVAPRSAAFSFRGLAVDLNEVRRRLQVAHAIEGSVRKAGSRLKLDVQLVDLQAGFPLWSESYELEPSEVLDLQSELATRVATELRGVLSDHDRRSLAIDRPHSLEAYECYARGRYLLHRVRRKAIEQAIRWFEHAIALDPVFAPAHACLADGLGWLDTYYGLGDRPRAEGESATAVALAPGSAEAHTSRGFALALAGRFAEAEPEFATAKALDPRLFEAHYYHGRARLAAGDPKSAADLFREAARVREDDYAALCLLVMLELASGEEERSRETARQALRRCERQLDLDPEDVRAYYLGARNLLHLGQVERAREWLERAAALDPEDACTQYNVACFWVVSGEAERALSALTRPRLGRAAGRPALPGAPRSPRRHATGRLTGSPLAALNAVC
jgi:adenylate cyclase